MGVISMSIYTTTDWRPRQYYILRNTTTNKYYMGQTTQDLTTYLGSGLYWKRHCEKWGGYNRENIQMMWSSWFYSKDDAEAWLKQFEEDEPGYYLAENETWANLCKENTHDNPFYDSSIQTRRIEDGTHHLLSGEIQSKTQKKMIEEGTHPFIVKDADGLTNNQKRLQDGTHAFLNHEKMVEAQKKRKENGNHHFLSSEWQKENQYKRVERGEHPFLEKKGKVACYDKHGNYIDIDRDLYYDQKGNKKDWKYVSINSKEARHRKRKC